VNWVNPRKLGLLADGGQESWKLPLPEFIVECYRKSFGRLEPEHVRSFLTAVLGATCPNDSSLRDLNGRILFSIFVATAAVVSDDASIEVDVVADTPARHEAVRNSGNVLSPAWSVRRAVMSASRSNGGTSTVPVTRVARLGTLPVLARSGTSSDSQAGTRDCASLPRVESSRPDRGTLPLRAGQPRRVAGRPVNYRSRRSFWWKPKISCC
jgi:hypothetical protein